MTTGKRELKKGTIILIEAFPDEHIKLKNLLVTNFCIGNIL
jgi:hypothetical protein